ncbi:MAG TPA: hypothetical protein VHM90_15055 [Phycisphaerae bacterium]|nr:hypothetical protein [Phycisphaerae bacterium]
MAKEIHLKADNEGAMLVSSAVDDPYIYVAETAGNGPQRVGSTLVFDTRVWQEVGKLPISVYETSTARPAISADGHRLYSRDPRNANGSFSPFHLQWADAGNSPLVTEPPLPRTGSTNVFTTDLFGEVVLDGNLVLSAEMQGAPFMIDSLAPACFLPHHPFIAGILSPPAARGGAAGNDKLALVSWNSGKTVATLDIGPKNPNAPARPKTSVNVGKHTFQYARQLLFDPHSQSLIVCDTYAMRVIPLKELAPPAEALLAARVTGDTQASVGRKAEWTITPADPALKIELTNPPAGMTLTAGKITWTPTSEQIGEVRIGLRISHDAEQRIREVPVRVSQPCLRLPFTPLYAEMSRDGKTALLSSFAASTSGAPFSGQPERKPRIALIDLENMRLIAETTLPQRYPIIHMDDRLIYLASNSSPAITLRKRSDLSDAGQFAIGTSLRNVVPFDGMLAVDAYTGVQIYKADDLRLIKSTPSTGAPSIEPSILDVVGLDDEIYISGTIWDAQLTKVKSIRTAIGLRNVGMPIDVAQMRPPTRWGVNLTESTGAIVRQGNSATGLFIPPGRGNFTNNPAASTIDSDVPACVSLYATDRSNSSSQGNQRMLVRAEVAFRDLVLGAPHLTIPVLNDPSALNGAEPTPANRGPNLQLYTRGGKIVVVAGDTLYSFAMPKLNATDFPQPLDIIQNAGVTVLGPQDSAKIHISARGGTPPYEFSLGRETPGVSIEKDGTLTIAKGTWFDAAINLLGDSRPRVDAQTGAEREPPPIDVFLQTGIPSFKLLTGHDPKGVPVSANIKVMAKDKSGAMAAMNFSVLLDVPMESVVAMRNRPADQQKMIEELQKQVRDLQQKVDQLGQQLNNAPKK